MKKAIFAFVQKMTSRVTSALRITSKLSLDSVSTATTLPSNDLDAYAFRLQHASLLNNLLVSVEPFWQQAYTNP